MATRPPASETAFSDAFTAASAQSDDGIPPIPADPPAGDPPAGDLPAGDPPPAEPPVAPPAGDPPAGDPPPADPPPAAEPPAAPPPAATPAAEEIVQGLMDALKAQPAPAPAAPAPAPEVPLYTPDEMNTLSEYEKNWPDVAQAETLKRRAEYHDLMKYMFTEVQKYIAPVFDQVRAMGNTLHTGEVKAQVADYSDTLEADVAAWVETQPSYLQAGMKQVMQGGTSDEVVDLIGRYRAATGAAPAPVVPAPIPPQTPAPKTELSNAAKQAAESLAPVSGDRSQIPVGQDPQDFTSAFARYATELMQ